MSAIRAKRPTCGSLQRVLLGLAVLLALALITVTARNSAGWVGSNFPGFFVMDNRVVPSIALPQWQIAGDVLFQNEVVAVGGAPVRSSRSVYNRVRAQPAGTLIRYTLRAPGGTVHTEVIASRRFTLADYTAIFGVFLLTGSAFLLTALLVFALRPNAAASVGFLSVGVIGGVFVLTAVDLYGPHWFFRLHVVAEALVPASLAHMALVFPSNRLRGRRAVLLAGIYLICLLLAGIYEWVLATPAAYSTVHLTATTAQALGGVFLISTVIYDLLTTRSVLVRRRILVAALGTVTAILVPTALMATSGLLNGRIPINNAALTGFLFPLSFGYAIAKRELLEIDVFVRDVALLVATLSTAYPSALAALSAFASTFL